MTQTKVQEALRRAAQIARAARDITPAEAVAETDNGTLWRYQCDSESPRTPVLIIYSLVNRPAILDLSAERSVVAHLIKKGFDVHLLAWRPPGQARRYLGLADYILGDIADAIGWLRRTSGAAPHVLGVCQGGVLALSYAATPMGQGTRSLTLLAAPIDTGSDSDRLAQLARSIDFNALIGATGNVPGQGLAGLFASLKPFALGPQRYSGLAELADADDQAIDTFMRMERWMYDGPDLAGQAFAEFAQQIYQDNALARGMLDLDGQRVDLSNVRCPVFNAYALDDHLVPVHAASGLEKRITGPCVEHALHGGHLGLFISKRAHQMLYPALSDWLHRIH